MHYGENDIRILKALQRGEVPTVGSDHRVHLEMLGFVVDGAAGLRITPKGTKLATVVPLRPEVIFDTRDALDRLDSWRLRNDLEQIRNEMSSIEAASSETKMEPAVASSDDIPRLNPEAAFSTAKSPAAGGDAGLL